MEIVMRTLSGKRKDVRYSLTRNIIKVQWGSAIAGIMFGVGLIDYKVNKPIILKKK